MDYKGMKIGGDGGSMPTLRRLFLDANCIGTRAIRLLCKV